MIDFLPSAHLSIILCCYLLDDLLDDVIDSCLDTYLLSRESLRVSQVVVADEMDTN